MPYTDSHCDRIRRDLAIFADRDTTPVFQVDGPVIIVQWTCRGILREQMFTVQEDESIKWSGAKNDDNSYDAFLRSSDVASFKTLAAAIIKDTQRVSPYVASGADLIDPGGDRESKDLSPEAFLARLDKGRSEDNALTELYFVKGAPGTGKTTLLHHAAVLQAERLIAGESPFLLFYISAQGRELSNLQDAFSSELDDLDAFFGKNAVSSLCRHGLLIPIIDGFDELLGTAGYSGAFTALQNLFEDLAGFGAVVVSARSAFYEFEFRESFERAGTSSGIALSTFDLQPWSDDQLVEYLKQTANGLSSEEITGALDTMKDHDRVLLTRPFFAQRLPDFLRSGQSFESGSLVDFLVSDYILRESKKITDNNGAPLMDQDGHFRFLEIVAEFMWADERRSLAQSDLEVIADMAGEEAGLTIEAKDNLKYKLTSYAGFTSSDGGEQFKFEHDVYFDYFLGCLVSRYLKRGDGKSVEGMMKVGLLSQDSLQRAVRSIDTDTFPKNLLTAPETATLNERRNRGNLVLSLAQEVGVLSDHALVGLQFFGLTFGPIVKFVGVTFEGCEFSMCDCCGTSFEDCSVDGTVLSEITIDDQTLLGIDGLVAPDVYRGALVLDKNRIYNPELIQISIERHGGPKRIKKADNVTARQRDLIVLVDIFLNSVRRTNRIFDDPDRAPRYQRALISNPLWSELRSLLADSECIHVDRASPAGGRRCDIIQIKVRPLELANGRSRKTEDARVNRFWTKLHSID